MQSVVSKAAMVPAPSRPRLCSLGVGVSFVGRARAPALKMKRLMVDSCIVGWVVQNEGRLFREIGRRLEQESMFEASVCGQRVFWFAIEGSPHFMLSSTSAETLCSVHESVHIIMKTFTILLQHSKSPCFETSESVSMKHFSCEILAQAVLFNVN